MQSCQSSGALKWEETAELQAVLKADRENPFKIPDVSRMSVAAQKLLEAMCQDEQYRGVNARVVGYGIAESDLHAHWEWAGMYEDMMAVERKRKGRERQRRRRQLSGAIDIRHNGASELIVIRASGTRKAVSPDEPRGSQSVHEEESQQ